MLIPRGEGPPSAIRDSGDFWYSNSSAGRLRVEVVVKPLNPLEDRGKLHVLISGFGSLSFCPFGHLRIPR